MKMEVKVKAKMKREVIALIVRPNTYLRTTICLRSSPEASGLEVSVRSQPIHPALW